MPDDCTWEEIHYRVYVRTKIERGLAVAASDVIPHDQVMREMEEWLASLDSVLPDAIRPTSDS